MVESYRDLVVWQKAIALVREVYRLSRAFPADERFGLTAQIRRAAVSVAANIAEGNGRYCHRVEYRRFLSMSRGSVSEVETYLVIVERLHFATTNDLALALSLTDEVSRMLTAMHKKLRNVRETVRVAGAKQ